MWQVFPRLACLLPCTSCGGGARVPFEAFLALGLVIGMGGVAISEEGELLELSREICFWRFAGLYSQVIACRPIPYLVAFQDIPIRHRGLPGTLPPQIYSIFEKGHSIL